MSNVASPQHTHAVMFHHFHNEKHPVGQGSISANKFSEMLDWLSERYSLISAEEYLYKLNNNLLKQNDICLTFDDALLCQAEIAGPILKERGLQAFFFIYSGPFKGSPDFLEIYRYFRNTQFSSVDDFYHEFFPLAKSLFEELYKDAEKLYDSENYLEAYPVYTENDKWFRWLRDDVLGKDKYDDVMSLIMREHNFEATRNTMDKLWMSDSHLKNLETDGHIVGLHSFSHPTTLQRLPSEKQAEEYIKNMGHLVETLNHAPIAMSHPCGSYNGDTLNILTGLGMEIGFRSNMSVADIKSNLEVPRQDHAMVLVEMSK